MDILKVLLLFLSTACLALAEDFYSLLGIERSANTREIRRAFKKLAIKLHPDKNPDPDAHDKFLKINRAYEVLKDEDLRKKYDTYGEEGLKEDHHSGRKYESWSFYNQNFGIYDDDLEIITLSRSDYEQAVENTDDVWFINYYSTHCSHCHDLAPTWREVARELEGVVRIGAVNCADDWMLCRQQGIRSYPSLVIYPSREKYYGDRVTRLLVRHALKAVGARVIELWTGNFASEMQDSEKAHHPWLITFCGEGGDCLLDTTLQKLAAMLSGLVNVAKMDCHATVNQCSVLGIDYGTYFFAAGQVKKAEGMEITSLDAREVALKTLEQLPDVTKLSKDKFEGILQDLKDSKIAAWLVHFVEGASTDLELRKLPAMLDHMNVGRVDCSEMRSFCNSMHFHKFPTFAVFKSGGGYEIHHGRLTAHDIAAFAKDSAITPVRVLGPDDFPQRVVESKDPWFVDFFAPWCPPCMRLLPEFRKASKNLEQVNFGTVDCTIHSGLCQNYNIRSYPTTILYNQSVPHQFQGHHNAESITEFIQDTLSPPVLSLTSANFDDLVTRKEEDQVWMVDFFAPWCGPCQQLAPEWRRLAKAFVGHKYVRVAMVDCQAQPDICQKQSVRSYPNIRLYPTGKFGSYRQYNGWYRDAQSLRAWAFEFLPTKSVALDWTTFQASVLEDTRPWIVDFYTPWCGHCQVFAPEFERVAQEMEGQVRAGKVDCQQHQWLCQQAGIRAYPTVRFYIGSPKPEMQQSLSGEDINSQSADYVIQFLQSRVAELNLHPRDHDEL